MIQSAQFIARSVCSKDKAIVFTGAFRPERLKDSDAAFNVGCAIGALNVLQRGVFVCMNGRVLSSERCRRDESSGKFEEM